MKKLLFCASLITFALQADPLLDAIHSSNPTKVKELLATEKTLDQKYLDIAHNILNVRAQERALNSSTTDSIPGSIFNKVGLAVGVAGTVKSMFNLKDTVFIRELIHKMLYKMPGAQEEGLKIVVELRERVRYERLTVACWLLWCGANVLAIHYKKIQLLEGNHKNALEVYSLIWDASKKA